MQNLFETDIEGSVLKNGDVKIDAKELKQLFLLIGDYHTILGNLLGELSPEEEKVFHKGMEFTEYVQNKYIVMGELREEQKKWYDALKRLDKKEYTKGMAEEEIDRLRKEVWGMYLEAKTKRENLKKELDKLSRNLPYSV